MSVIVGNKFCSIIEKNVGFKKLNDFNEVLSGDFAIELDLDWDFCNKFKFAHMSCDTERLFLAYKYVLPQIISNSR